VPPPPASDDKRIRQGLKYLFKADSAAVRAAGYLKKLLGIANPPTAASVLKPVVFKVPGHKHKYKGRMTKAQATYLKTQTGTQKMLADAIAEVLINIDHAVLDALEDLGLAQGAPGPAPTPAAKMKALDGLQKGCCTYDDTQQEGITQATCVGGLVGTWKFGPCPPPGKPHGPEKS
jgi:hypothetical protein